MPLPPTLHEEIEDELRARLLALVADGSDVVLDFSFWSRQARNEYRRLLRPLGVEAETIYLATSREIALQRMRTRRLEHPDDFTLPDRLAAEYFDHFEPPTKDEGPLTIIQTGPAEHVR
jgi:predicted kinase